HTNALPEAWLPEGPCHRPPGPDSALARYLAAARASGLRVHSMFVGFDGQSYADPASAARTVGLAVPALRAHRLQVAQACGGVACHLGAEALALHVGHLPPAGHPDYANLARAVGLLADSGAARGLGLHLETGQEPAETLRHFVVDVARPNVGVNFDPGNF